MVSLDSTVHGPDDLSIGAMLTVLTVDQPGTKYSHAQVIEFCNEVLIQSRFFKLRTSCLFAQMMHETNYLRYTGDVPFGNHNFAGIGATGGVPGVKNPSIRYGVIQVCVHHLAYVYGDPAKFPNGGWGEFVSYDPRYDAVRRAGYWGVVETWRDYSNGRWAYSKQYPVGSLENGYASAIVKLANYVLGRGTPEMSLTETVRDRIRARGVDVHDIRNQMLTQGAYDKLPNSAWIYTAVHYTGVDRGVRNLQGDIDSWIGHSRHHVQTNGWPGIAYALGVSQSGRVFILRDIELKGFHGYAANSNALAVCGDMGGTNKPTTELLKGLQGILLALHGDSPEFLNLTGHAGTYGHQELKFIDTRNSTGCPGALLDVVRQYRQTGRIIDTGERTLYFEETGQTLALGFLGEWETLRSGIRPHGYPITPEYDSQIHQRRVQYTERSRFEWHPGGGEYEIQLGHVGRQIYELELLWSTMHTLTEAEVRNRIEHIVRQQW